MKIRQVKLKDANNKLDTINELSKRVNDPNSNVEFRFDFIRDLTADDLNYRNINVQANNRVVNFLNRKNKENSKSLHINFLNNLRSALSSADLISKEGQPDVGRLYDDSNKQDMISYNTKYYKTTFGNGTEGAVWFDSNGKEITDYKDINDKASYGKITKQFIYTWFDPEESLELNNDEIMDEMNYQLKSSHNEDDKKMLVNWDLLKKNISKTDSKFAKVFIETKNQVFIKKLNIFVLVSTYYSQTDESKAPVEIKEYEAINDENYKDLLTLKGDEIAYLSNKNQATVPSKVPVPTKMEAKAFAKYNGKLFESEVVEKDNALDLVDNSLYGASNSKDEFYTGIVDCIEDVMSQIKEYVDDNKEDLTKQKIEEIIDNVRKNYHYLFDDVKDRSKELFEAALPNSTKEEASKTEKAKATRTANKNVEYDMKHNEATAVTSLVKKLLNDYKNYLIKSIDSTPVKDLKQNKQKVLDVVNELDDLDTDDILSILKLTDDFADELKLKVDLVYNKKDNKYDFVKGEDPDIDKSKYKALKLAIKKYMESLR